mgnify:CR=1 FL=1
MNSINAEIGKQIAYENAFDKLWQLFGFELKQRIGGDWRYRLNRERNELSERLDKLRTYLVGEQYLTSPKDAPSECLLF